MCTVLLPPGVNLIAVNKYIIYHIFLIMVMPYVIQTFAGLLLPQPRLQARDNACWIYGGRSGPDAGFCPNRSESVWMKVIMALP
jgi:hypothetical protein